MSATPVILYKFYYISTCFIEHNRAYGDCIGPGLTVWIRQFCQPEAPAPSETSMIGRREWPCRLLLLPTIQPRLRPLKLSTKSTDQGHVMQQRWPGHVLAGKQTCTSSRRCFDTEHLTKAGGGSIRLRFRHGLLGTC